MRDKIERHRRLNEEKCVGYKIFNVLISTKEDEMNLNRSHVHMACLWKLEPKECMKGGARIKDLFRKDKSITEWKRQTPRRNPRESGKTRGSRAYGTWKKPQKTGEKRCHWYTLQHRALNNSRSRKTRRIYVCTNYKNKNTTNNNYLCESTYKKKLGLKTKSNFFYGPFY